MDLTTTLKEIETWPVDDQLELVQQVWDRLADAGWRPTLTDDQKAELDRRLEALEKNPDEVETWDAIVEHVRHVEP